MNQTPYDLCCCSCTHVPDHVYTPFYSTPRPFALERHTAALYLVFLFLQTYHQFGSNDLRESPSHADAKGEAEEGKRS